MEEIYQDAVQRMNKSIDALRAELARLRTGRASTALLETIKVNYYGVDTPLNQLAGISVADPRTLSVSPWDKGAVPAIEKAIMESDLGLNPVTSGELIRVPLPALTEERRKELTKVVRHEGENIKVAVRNIRRDAIHHAKEMQKSGELSEDQLHKLEADIQKATDEHTKQADEMVRAKEQEVMEV